MKIFNKIWVIIDILFGLVVLTAALAMPDMSIVWLRQGLDALAPRVAALGPVGRLVLAAAAVVVDLLLLVLIYLEVRKAPTTHARVRQVGGGVVEVAFETIRQRLLHEVSAVPDVIKATPHIGARGGKVDVQVDVETSPHVNIPEKAAEIVGVIRRALETEMGLTMQGKPEVRIRHGAYRDVAPARPAAAPRPALDSSADPTPVLPKAAVSVPLPPGEEKPPTEPSDD